MAKVVQCHVAVDSDDWTNRLREIVLKVASKIPYAGGAVSVILGLCWPADKTDIFKAIAKDVEYLIDEKILAKELEDGKSKIDALRDTIKSYSSAQGNERSGWLTTWNSKADDLSVSFRESSNNIHLIPLTVTVALLHLSALRERLNFGKDIYGTDNTTSWKKDLNDAYHLYVVDFLPTIYKKWKSWRSDQIVITLWVSQHATAIPPFYVDQANATVEDKVSGLKMLYFEDQTSRTYEFQDVCDAHKTRICNDAYTNMAGCISPSFVFYKIVPSSTDPAYDKDLFSTMFLGPYAQDLIQWTGSQGPPAHNIKAPFNDYSSSSGPISKFIIREWNSIDAMQFIYANASGTMAGNSSGGEKHEVYAYKTASGFRMGFSNGLLCYVQVLFSDGTVSDHTYGNRSNWGCAQEVAQAPPTYKLTSWSFGVNNGPSDTYGPGVMIYQYEYTEENDPTETSSSTSTSGPSIVRSNLP